MASAGRRPPCPRPDPRTVASRPVTRLDPCAFHLLGVGPLEVHGALDAVSVDGSRDRWEVLPVDLGTGRNLRGNSLHVVLNLGRNRCTEVGDDPFLAETGKKIGEELRERPFVVGAFCPDAVDVSCHVCPPDVGEGHVIEHGRAGERRRHVDQGALTVRVMVSGEVVVVRELAATVTAGLGLQLDDEDRTGPDGGEVGPARHLVLVTTPQLKLVHERG